MEVQAPTRRRAFSIAITAPDERDQGQPTSWSAAIDALAAGRSFDSTSQGLVYLDNNPNRRLFVACAGNVTNLDTNHLDRSDTEPVHDPAQAWNALTVGAPHGPRVAGRRPAMGRLEGRCAPRGAIALEHHIRDVC